MTLACLTVKGGVSLVVNAPGNTPRYRPQTWEDRMRFYRVDHYDETEGSFGFSWHTSKRAADKERRARGTAKEIYGRSTIDAVDIEPSKRGILWALRVYATHPDNG